MKQAGFIYALYIGNNFIEHFKTVDDAKNFADKSKLQGTSDVFVRPIVYFTCQKDAKK